MSNSLSRHIRCPFSGISCEVSWKGDEEGFSTSVHFIPYDQLHRELDRRSDATTLEERGILRNSDTGALASRLVELEHNMKKDAVDRGLKERSDMNTLVESGIQSTPLLFLCITQWIPRSLLRYEPVRLR